MSSDCCLYCYRASEEATIGRSGKSLPHPCANGRCLQVIFKNKLLEQGREQLRPAVAGLFVSVRQARKPCRLYLSMQKLIAAFEAEQNTCKRVLCYQGLYCHAVKPMLEVALTNAISTSKRFGSLVPMQILPRSQLCALNCCFRMAACLAAACCTEVDVQGCRACIGMFRAHITCTRPKVHILFLGCKAAIKLTSETANCSGFRTAKVQLSERPG